MPRLPLIVGGVVLLVVLGLGGGFLRLGMNAVPPEQTEVHKVLPASAFAAAPVDAAPLPAMPAVPASGPGVAAPDAAPSAQAPLPTMPAPKPAPTDAH